MENKITFTEREILLLFRGISELLSSLEEDLDDCYSCGDLKCADQVLEGIKELGILSGRLALFVSPSSILNIGGDD